MILRSAVSLVVASAFACFACASPPPPAPRLPLEQNGGTWPTSHVQGIAVDLDGGYIYYSFTTLLSKYDFDGNLIGTIDGWTGHLGDIDFNPRDGRIYGSLEYKDAEAFYIAVIDVDRLDRPGMTADASDVMTTVYLPEVARDYAADMNQDGVFDGNVGDTEDHRYGCSGIDGVAFGPAFGHTDGAPFLTVAYGIYANDERTDNDHQVLLQYDVSAWAAFETRLDERAPHRNGPEALAGKYFVRTGNTTYGVQTLAYDAWMERWFLGVYRGQKATFPNYRLFAVEGRPEPVTGDLIGVPGQGGQGFERGMLLPLADDGLEDAGTGIRGWMQQADVGFQPVGGGRFYIAAGAAVEGGQTADLTLVRWTGDREMPFAPVTGDRR